MQEQAIRTISQHAVRKELDKTPTQAEVKEAIAKPQGSRSGWRGSGGVETRRQHSS